MSRVNWHPERVFDSVERARTEANRQADSLLWPALLLILLLLLLCGWVLVAQGMVFANLAVSQIGQS